MATLTSAQAAAGVQPVVPVGNVAATVYGEYSLAAALAGADVIQMVKVPLGAIIVNAVLSADDLDTGGSPAIALQLGDGGSAARFISASTIAQAGGVAALNVPAGHGFVYTAEDTVDVTVSTGPATGATTGKVRLTLTYKMSTP